jgi:hypothetical protein
VALIEPLARPSVWSPADGGNLVGDVVGGPGGLAAALHFLGNDRSRAGITGTPPDGRVQGQEVGLAGDVWISPRIDLIASTWPDRHG